jgi:hypothetical protein
MSIRVMLTATALAAALYAAPAHAEILDFSYFNGKIGLITWTQPSDPTPSSSINGQSTEATVSNSMSRLEGFTEVLFNNSAFGGGLGITISVFDIMDHGPQLYTGSEAEPMFSVGTFNLGEGTLTVTAAPVPEPSTWAMMLLGFAGLGFAGYRTRRAASALRQPQDHVEADLQCDETM